MIKIENVKKSYGGKTVLSINSFCFKQGLSYALVGSNGCGKSTLLKILASTLKPDEGTIIFDEKAIYSPQMPYALRLSVLDNVLIGIKDKKLLKDKAIELLNRLNLSDMLKKRGDKLSGGETQRMALARTIILDADILLLDEPTSAMDIESSKTAENLIDEWKQQNNGTIIFATHSLRQAQRLADIIIFLKDGKIVEFGNKTTIVEQPNTEEFKQFLEFFN